MEKWERKIIKHSSIEIEGGGDSHFHIFGPKESDFVVTTRLPIGIEFHDHVDIRVNRCPSCHSEFGHRFGCAVVPGGGY